MATSTNTIKVNFVLPNGELVPVEARIGLSVLEAAHSSLKVGSANLQGACEGSLACSTCHVIMSKEGYGKFPSATEDEEDMLDLAFGLTETSRLGCQLVLKEEHEGLTFTIPPVSRNNV